MTIYLDHAATSWPKPPAVIETMRAFLEKAGGNPGRSGHSLSIAAARVVYGVRETVADLFHAPDPLRVIFTSNATHAINLALHGLLKSGNRVVTGGMEHNAVMRPLRYLEGLGVEVVTVPCAPDGTADLDGFRRAIRPGTSLVAINHASNVTGTLAPVVELAGLAHTAGALFLMDAAQTAGVLPIDMQTQGIDLLAFTGHKGLQGPPGTGGLVLGLRVDSQNMLPLIQGGTGSRSGQEIQPECLPDKFESGTPNGIGIAGLEAGIHWVQERGLEDIRRHEMMMAEKLREGLGNLTGVTVYGPKEMEWRTAVLSCTVYGKHVSEIGLRLEEEAGVLCRVGLHCAPAAHKCLGTFPEGTVRFSPGPLTTLDDIDRAITAMARLVRP